MWIAIGIIGWLAMGYCGVMILKHAHNKYGKRWGLGSEAFGRILLLTGPVNLMVGLFWLVLDGGLKFLGKGRSWWH